LIKNNQKFHVAIYSKIQDAENLGFHPTHSQNEYILDKSLKWASKTGFQTNQFLILNELF